MKTDSSDKKASERLFFPFLSEHSDGSTFRGSIILESNQTILQPDASRPPCSWWCHDPG